jgi:membrane protein DedA with SNARE-associated domain
VATNLYQILSHFFASYGYWAVFFGVMLENAGIPVPGETVLLFAGFLAFEGQLDLWRVVLTAIAGATIGDSLGFVVGRLGGTALIRKYRGHFFFPAKRFDRAQATFLKWGHWAVFAARFVTGLRVLAGPFAGAFQMAYPRFLLSNFSGAVAWGLVIASVGFAFGSNWERLLRLVKDTNLIILVLVIAGAAGVLYWRWRKKN